MKLRDYQERAIAATRDHLGRYRSTLAVLPTGTGKTVLFSHLAANWPDGKTLILAHREELVRQAYDKVCATGEIPGVEMAENSSQYAHNVIIASVQTLSRPNRLARFRPDEFGLCIIDEAHHAAAASYRRIIDHFSKNPDFRYLGVTATPKRGDDVALGSVFESVAFNYELTDAVADGYLVPIRQRVVNVESLDFSRVSTVAGDFHQGELEDVVTQEKPLHAMAAPVAEMAKGQAVLVFCVSVKHARQMAAVLERYIGEGKVAWLSGESEKQQRQDTIKAYKDGRIQILCNCGLFLEGFDAPNTRIVVMGRPTKSIGLYLQVLGRVTRPLDSVGSRLGDLVDPASRRALIAQSDKPYGVVLDFVGNHQRHAHKQITAADALGGKYSEAVRQYARKMAEEDPAAANMDDLLEQAEAEVALLAEEDARRARVQARASYQVQDYQDGEIGLARDQGVTPRDEPATNKQRWKLKTLGVSWYRTEGMTRRQAHTLIGKLMQQEGVAS